MAEEYLQITGGYPLRGEVTVQGAKNSALPLMAASVLCGGETVLTNVPRLTDVFAASRILNRLGCRCRIEDHTVTVQPGLTGCEIPDADMRQMRSSVMFLGPLLAKAGRCVMTMPGGCELGPRPIDMHLDAMRQMGAHITEEQGRIVCDAGRRLHGTRIPLPFPSVGVTENVMMAASLAEGDTVLTNAAREPEIVDLARFLCACGAEITGAGEGTVCIAGRDALHGAEFRVMPDRIAAFTWLCAGAATGGTVTVRGTYPPDLESSLSVLRAAGCRIGICGDRILLDGSGPLHRVRSIRTMPYPGFPTDAQAPVTAVLALARGTSMIEETVFESRYKHIGELLRMGADIRVSGSAAVITGVPALHGAAVRAMDLRGGAALAIAAAAAQGESRLSGLYHLDRGYESLSESFHSLGCKTVRRALL